MKTFNLQPLKHKGSKAINVVSELRVKEYCNVERCFKPASINNLCSHHSGRRKRYGDNFLNHTSRINEEEAQNQDIDIDMIKLNYHQDLMKSPQAKKALENLRYFLIMQRH